MKSGEEMRKELEKEHNKALEDMRKEHEEARRKQMGFPPKKK